MWVNGGLQGSHGRQYDEVYPLPTPLGPVCNRAERGGALCGGRGRRRVGVGRGPPSHSPKRPCRKLSETDWLRLRACVCVSVLPTTWTASPLKCDDWEVTVSRGYCCSLRVPCGHWLGWAEGRGMCESVSVLAAAALSFYLFSLLFFAVLILPSLVWSLPPHYCLILHHSPRPIFHPFPSLIPLSSPLTSPLVLLSSPPQSSPCLTLSRSRSGSCSQAFCWAGSSPLWVLPSHWPPVLCCCGSVCCFSALFPSSLSLSCSHSLSLSPLMPRLYESQCCGGFSRS